MVIPDQKLGHQGKKQKHFFNTIDFTVFAQYLLFELWNEHLSL